MDVSTIVEVETPQGPFPLVHTLRDADIRDVADLTIDLRGVKAQPSVSRSGRWLSHAAPAVARIPGLVRAMYAVIARSKRVRQRTGTVSVTAVGMFADGGGFAIAPMTLMSVQVVVGGIAQRPRFVGGQVANRDLLDLTVSIDHNVVDGGRAARFGAELRHLVETASVLDAQA